MNGQEQRSPVTNGITISFLRLPAHHVPLSFKVRIQIDLGGHRVAWELIMAPDTAIPIELDTTQKLILLAKEGELLVDSSQMARDFPIILEEQAILGTISRALPLRAKGETIGERRERNSETMSQEESYDAANHYRYLHLPPEELARLSQDELLQATLEARRLIDLLIGVLHTPDTSLILRAVTMDLLYIEAERRSREPGGGENTPVTYAIKGVSERLGIRPAAVRQAYEQLDALHGVEIVARQFPQRRRTQMRLPLDETSGGTDGDEEMP